MNQRAGAGGAGTSAKSAAGESEAVMFCEGVKHSQGA